MKPVFADTYYFVALVNPIDGFHSLAHDYSAAFGGVNFIELEIRLKRI